MSACGRSIGPFETTTDASGPVPSLDAGDSVSDGSEADTGPGDATDVVAPAPPPEDGGPVDVMDVVDVIDVIDAVDDSADADLADTPETTDSLGCIEPLDVPGDVRASFRASAEFVTLIWTPVDAAERYEILRDGESIGTSREPFYVDSGAAEGVLPSAPEAFTAIGRAEFVELSWTAAAGQPGTQHAYQIRALADGCLASASSEPVTGARAAWPVIDYEWETSIGVSGRSSGRLLATDSSAPAPVIVPGAAQASDGQFERTVRLIAEEPLSLPGESVGYRVRALTDGGSGEWTAWVSAARVLEGVEVQWETAASGEGPWETVAGAITLTADDRNAPAEGDVRWYRPVFSASGASPQFGAVDSGYRQTFGFGAPCETSVDCTASICSAGTCVYGGWASIPAGSFVMGSPVGEVGRDVRVDETQHPVTLTRPFAMMTAEFSQQEWLDVYGSSRSFWIGCGLNCPADKVTWWGTLYLANRLSESLGLLPCYALPDPFTCANGLEPEQIACDEPRVEVLTASGSVYDCEGIRLPTEAEWEYAYRAGTTTALYNGELTFPGSIRDPNLAQIAWYISTTNNTGPRPSRTLAPNGFGLYDMAGNSFEHVWDWYAVYPSSAVDPQGPELGEFRVMRGGMSASGGLECRAAYRRGQAPGVSSPNAGFRFVRTIDSALAD